METKLPAKAVELLRKPVLAHIATVMQDGSPQVTPVWVDTDGEYILINTAEGRVKTRNVKRNPRVAVSMTDPESPWAGSLWARGTVVEITTAGANDHISFLAKKYTGAERYNFRPGEVRVILKIRPDSISGGVTRG
ncbi:MAG: PPOX class F420-dependent oxidoreductase [Dehalococcoidia bacterium]|nr:PPOX class F420-dependent oxidoreductase [Dehalococcoidia bacterium]